MEPCGRGRDEIIVKSGEPLDSKLKRTNFAIRSWRNSSETTTAEWGNAIGVADGPHFTTRVSIRGRRENASCRFKMSQKRACEEAPTMSAGKCVRVFR